MISNRIDRARKAVEFCHVGTERKGIIQTVFVPGHEGRKYRVILKRGKGLVTLECQRMLPYDTSVLCPGGCKTVCYHCMAALIFTAHQAGFDTSFCESKEDALRLKNLHEGALMMRVVSKHAPSNGCFAVFGK